MIKEEKKKSKNSIQIIKKILWILVYILLCFSIYKVYLYGNYSYYISEYIKNANFYYSLKGAKEKGESRLDYKYDGEYIKFKVKEYYLLPLERRIILEGEGTYYNEKEKEEKKEIYGINFYFYGGYLDVEEYVDDKKKLEELKNSKLVYKFNEEQLNEFLKKVERKSREING